MQESVGSVGQAEEAAGSGVGFIGDC